MPRYCFRQTNGEQTEKSSSHLFLIRECLCPKRLYWRLSGWVENKASPISHVSGSASQADCGRASREILPPFLFSLVYVCVKGGFTGGLLGRRNVKLPPSFLYVPVLLRSRLPKSRPGKILPPISIMNVCTGGRFAGCFWDGQEEKLPIF